MKKGLWRPIKYAPQDATPVWVRGYDFGNPANPRHYTYAYWDGNTWIGADSSTLHYLTDFYDNF